MPVQAENSKSPSFRPRPVGVLIASKASTRRFPSTIYLSILMHQFRTWSLSRKTMEACLRTSRFNSLMLHGCTLLELIKTKSKPCHRSSHTRTIVTACYNCPEPGKLSFSPRFTSPKILPHLFEHTCEYTTNSFQNLSNLDEHTCTSSSCMYRVTTCMICAKI